MGHNRTFGALIARGWPQSSQTRRSRLAGRVATLLMISTSLAAGALSAQARGGVGGGGGAPAAPPPAIKFLPKAGPPLEAAPDPAPNGFLIVGLLENATTKVPCASAKGSSAGGTATINGVKITIPADTIVQLPAQTLKWAEVVCPDAGASPIALDGSAGNGGAATLYPSAEFHIQGNIKNAPGAGTEHVAALVNASQLSLNEGSGYISSIDYADGSIYVSTAGGEARLVINDPKGRYGRAQTSLDARFAVDDENPSIKAATGYPMCVPRVAPPLAGSNVETDPLCPQKNRPIAKPGVVPCRNFAAANTTLPKAPIDLPQPVANPAVPNLFCTAFVMKGHPGMPGTASLAATQIRNPNDPLEPDPREQAPLEIGDFITWKGTLVRDATKPPATTPHTAPSTNLIWVYDIKANVGIFTQPHTLPAYVAIEEALLGVDPMPARAPDAAVPVPIETTNRFRFVGFTTDVSSLVDVYFTDIAPTGSNDPAQSFRWVTMEGVTNTLADQAAGRVPFAVDAQPFGGGIQTQFTEAAPGRAHADQNKVPAIDPTQGTCPPLAGSQACAITQSPTRYVRAVLRSLCAPTTAGAAGSPTGNPGNLDGGPFFDINGGRPPLPGATGGDGSCLHSARFANGLFTGQYSAPTAEFIFAEVVVPGAPIPANNFWQLGFLVKGEGGLGGNSQAPQNPRPW